MNQIWIQIKKGKITKFDRDREDGNTHTKIAGINHGKTASVSIIEGLKT